MLGGRPRPARGAAGEGTPGHRASHGRPARGLQLCTRRDAGPPPVNFCGLQGGGGSRSVGRRSPPAPGPHPACARPAPRARSCVCSAAPPCSCSYAARSRPPPTQARPGQGNPRQPFPTRGICGWGPWLLFLRPSETWCPPGPAGVTEPRPGRRDERLASCENLEREPLLVPACWGKVGMGGCVCAGTLQGTEVCVCGWNGELG